MLSTRHPVVGPPILRIIFAIFVEAAIFRYLPGVSVRRALKTSTIANEASLVFGLIFIAMI